MISEKEIAGKTLFDAFAALYFIPPQEER